MKRITSIFFVIVLGCSGDKIQNDEKLIEDSLSTVLAEKEIPGQARNDERVFLEFYNRFAHAITERNVDDFNACVHPEKGFFIIERPGAVPNVIRVPNFQEFDTLHTWPSLKKLNLLENDYMPKFESFPTVICDSNTFDKNGCFVQEYNGLLDTGNWFYGLVDSVDMEDSKYLAESIKYTVLNTRNYSYSFSNIDGAWYLSFMNIMVPCDI